MDLKERELLGDRQDDHWYYVSKFDALMRCLDRPPDRVLDVGAGSGFFSKRLLERTAARRAVCVDTGYAEDWSERVAGKAIDFRRDPGEVDADLVLLMDVIEHVDDDVGLIAQYARAARPGTRFVVSVPAFPWLWSAHDEFLEHRRRYTLSSLVDALTAGGLAPGIAFYFFAAIFPAAAASRLWHRWWSPEAPPASDLRRHHPWTNRFLTRVGHAESAIARHNRAFGLTVFAAATRP